MSHPFEIGDTVECIENQNEWGKADTTIGKTYVVKDRFTIHFSDIEDAHVIIIESDLGKDQSIAAYWFKSKEIDYLQISKEICGKL